MSEVKPNRANPLRVTEKGRTLLSVGKVQKLLEAMIDGHKVRDAAEAAGLRVNRARRILTDQAVRRELSRRIEVLSESNRARNILLRETLRDRGLDPDAPAALAKVALEAARQLDGDEKQGGITINGGQNVIAGYVIDLRGDAEGPRAITNRSADGSKPLIRHEAVTDVEG